jgi:hypothetical protein
VEEARNKKDSHQECSVGKVQRDIMSTLFIIFLISLHNDKLEKRRQILSLSKSEIFRTNVINK